MSRLSWPSFLLLVLLVSGCALISGEEERSPAKVGALSSPQNRPAVNRQQNAAVMRPPVAKPMMNAGQRQIQQNPVSDPFAGTLPSTGPAKVALLAPLSGPSAPLGQAMVNAAQLALFDVGQTNFELMPRDTKGTAQGAVQAARDALGNGAQMVIGPLFAADVVAVKAVIKNTNVNMLALSTDVSLAEGGVFVMGFAPAPQVERVVSYAISRGLRKFAAVIPVGPYGALVARAFEQAVQKNGGTLLVTTALGQIANLAGQKEQIDAIFLPFGGAPLRQAAKELQAAGFDHGRTRLLGTGLWDEPDLAKTEPYLVGGWYAAAEPVARERYNKIYRETYGGEAPRLSTLAYDATALAAMLARRASLYDRNALCTSLGFAGLDGIFRLMPDGKIERGLAVLEVEQLANKVIAPSPQVFEP